MTELTFFGLIENNLKRLKTTISSKKYNKSKAQNAWMSFFWLVCGQLSEWGAGIFYPNALGVLWFVANQLSVIVITTSR